jgi:glycosyl transferase family 4
MTQPRRFVMICSGDAAPVTSAPRDGGDEGCTRFLRDLSTSLTRLGHEVETWTVQRDGQPPVEGGPGGTLIRRFPGQRDYLVPRLRPCWWVSEWVTCATAHLAKSPNLSVTLVTFGWEAGAAGRLLAQRFGLDLVHVPDAPSSGRATTSLLGSGDADASYGATRRREEDVETCRYAVALVATSLPAYDAFLSMEPQWVDPDRVTCVTAGADVAARFVAALPPARRDQAGSTPPDAASLASLADDEDSPSASSAARRQPWHFEMEFAKSAMSGRHVMF